MPDMDLKCDVQYGKTDSEFRLTRVGVTGVKKPVMVKRNGDKNELNKSLNCPRDIFVDLPAEQKGSHMSRNVEVLTDVVMESLNEPVSGLENMASDMCRRLLIHHEYAHVANVSIYADYFKPRKTPNGRDTYEVYRLNAKGTAVRGKGIRKTIGAEVIGMTACPCAQQTVTEILDCSGGVTVMSHNQRNICSASITMDEGFEIEADVLIDLIEESFSSPTFELLKERTRVKWSSTPTTTRNSSRMSYAEYSAESSPSSRTSDDSVIVVRSESRSRYTSTTHSPRGNPPSELRKEAE